ncbi:MAG: putative ribonuclease III [Parcubacteria group bacterium Gr01-1014_38]|nr:MAG: putative ribonuclease III [Parcubacteria group bacterium Gr01-1014_38]
MSPTTADLRELEEHLNVRFKNRKLLETALTHRSYLNENPGVTLEQNERLEFLGDAVLELVVTEHLYKEYAMPEGVLTNLRASIVRGEMLAKVAAAWNLDAFLRLSRGERRDTGKARHFILANAVEAVIGAVYLDQGLTGARKLIHRDIVRLLPDVIEKGLHVDAKSRFQELVQERSRMTPAYQVLSETGPDHAKVFRVVAIVGNDTWGEGSGSSKQEAEQAAARAALSRFERERGTGKRRGTRTDARRA